MRKTIVFAVLTLFIIANGCKKDPQPEKPAAPTELIAVTLSQTEVALSWKDNSNNEEEFVLERASPGGEFVPLATVASDVTSYTDSQIEPGLSYRYRVKAVNDVGSSGYSNMVANAVEQLPVPPEAPRELTAKTISSTAILLEWKDASHNESGFIVERAVEEPAGFEELKRLGTDVASFMDATVEPGKEYFYRLKAHNEFGTSDGSNIASAVTRLELQILEAPSKLRVKVFTSNQLEVCWNDNSTGETGFKLEMGKVGEMEWHTQYAIPADTTCFIVKGLEPNTSYKFRIQALRGIESSAYSQAVIVTTTGILISAPSALQAAAVSHNRINLRWTDNSTNEDNFVLERKSYPNGRWLPMARPNANRTSHTDGQGLQPNTTYQYRIRAQKGRGYSDYSNISAATTRPHPSQQKAKFKVFNQSNYNIIFLRINGVQMIRQGQDVAIGEERTLEYEGTATLSYEIGIGLRENGSPRVLFTKRGTITIPRGAERRVVFQRPSLGEVLTGGQPSRNWESRYQNFPTAGTARYIFLSDGSWKQFNNGRQIGAGRAQLQSWPSNSRSLQFKLCSTCEVTELTIPFRQFSQDAPFLAGSRRLSYILR